MSQTKIVGLKIPKVNKSKATTCPIKAEKIKFFDDSLNANISINEAIIDNKKIEMNNNHMNPNNT